MIGRGALINPLLFHQIRAHFTGIPFSPATDCITTYLETFVSSFPAALTQKGRIGKIKQLFSFLFRANPFLLAHRPSMLTHQETSPLTLMKTFVPILEKGFFS
jgi:tRNA-dihydrouridine synthase C